MISVRCSSMFLHSVARFPVFAAGLVFFLIAGCGKSSNEVADPQLKPIQEMLNSQLPTGSSEGTVQQFLSARGYPIERTSQPGTLVALIRHIDTEKLQPVTARVTFYFDANGRLNTTEIERTFNRRPPMELTDSKNPPDATDPNNPPNTTDTSNSTNP